jgi:hypothetical protein
MLWSRGTWAQNGVRAPETGCHLAGIVQRAESVCQILRLVSKEKVLKSETNRSAEADINSDGEV